MTEASCNACVAASLRPPPSNAGVPYVAALAAAAILGLESEIGRLCPKHAGDFRKARAIHVVVTEVARALLCEALGDAGRDGRGAAVHDKSVECIICGTPCLEDAEGPERWSWGPDGMHCHYRCEVKFMRRFPHLFPVGHVPRGRQ